MRLYCKSIQSRFWTTSKLVWFANEKPESLPTTSSQDKLEWTLLIMSNDPKVHQELEQLKTVNKPVNQSQINLLVEIVKFTSTYGIDEIYKTIYDEYQEVITAWKNNTALPEHLKKQISEILVELEKIRVAFTDTENTQTAQRIELASRLPITPPEEKPSFIPYTVVSGDSLSKILKKIKRDHPDQVDQNLTVNQLKAYHNVNAKTQSARVITDKDLILVDETILIPTKTSPTAVSTPEPKPYLKTVSDRLGTAVKEREKEEAEIRSFEREKDAITHESRKVKYKYDTIKSARDNWEKTATVDINMKQVFENANPKKSDGLIQFNNQWQWVEGGEQIEQMLAQSPVFQNSKLHDLRSYVELIQKDKKDTVAYRNIVNTVYDVESLRKNYTQKLEEINQALKTTNAAVKAGLEEEKKSIINMLGLLNNLFKDEKNKDIVMIRRFKPK